MIATGQGLTGNNMFVYCGNNPVIRSDKSGSFWREIALVAFVVEAVVIIGNYINNSKMDSNPDTTTRNRIINDQNYTTGQTFKYGLYSAQYNACEAIAVHNANVLLGRDSSLSGTIHDFHLSGARIGLGYFGSNPLAIGNVLKNEGIDYSTASINSMTESGVYIISYWHEDWQTEGLHTIAVDYDGTAYTAYNLAGDGTTSKFNPSDYSSRFICGYYLGG